MANPLDVLSTLNPLSWRNILLPYTSRKVGFQHVNAEHKFNFAGEQIEPTGPKAITFEFTVPFLQSLSSTARYGNLFGSIMPKIWAAMLDKSPGPLYDPVTGRIWRCVPATLADETVPTTRDGTEMVLSWIHSPEDPEDLRAFEVLVRSDLLTAAGSLDMEVKKVDWKQYEPPPQTVNPLQLVGGLADQIETGVNKNLNGLEKFIADTEDMEDQIEQLEDPKTFALKRRARRARDLAYRMRAAYGNPRKRLRTVTTNYLMSVSQAAQFMGLAIVDFLAINTDLIGLTEIPAETKIKGYQEDA